MPLVGGGAQRTADVFEHVLQAVAGQLQGSDDHNRDQGGDQTIFDGGRARFVSDKTKNFLMRFKATRFIGLSS
jgi:hypothetical protein